MSFDGNIAEEQQNEHDTGQDLDYSHMSESQEAQIYELEMSLRGEKRPGSPLQDEEPPFKLANVRLAVPTQNDGARGTSPPSSSVSQIQPQTATSITQQPLYHPQDYEDFARRLSENTSQAHQHLAYPTPQTVSTTAYSPQQFVQPTRFFAQAQAPLAARGAQTASPERNLPHFNEMLANLKQAFSDDTLFAGQQSPPLPDAYEADNTDQSNNALSTSQQQSRDPRTSQQHIDPGVAPSQVLQQLDEETHEEPMSRTASTSSASTQSLQSYSAELQNQARYATGRVGLGISGIQSIPRYHGYHDPARPPSLTPQIHTPAPSPGLPTFPNAVQDSSRVYAGHPSSATLTQSEINQELQRQDKLQEQQLVMERLNQPQAPQDSSQDRPNETVQQKQIQQEHSQQQQNQSIRRVQIQSGPVQLPPQQSAYRQPRTVHISRAGDPPAATYTAMQMSTASGSRNATAEISSDSLTGGRRGSLMPGGYGNNVIPQLRSAPPSTNMASQPSTSRSTQAQQPQVNAEYLAALNAHRHHALSRQGSLSATLAPPPAPVLRVTAEEHAYIRALAERREIAKKNIDNQALAEDVRQYWTHEYLRTNEEVEHFGARLSAAPPPSQARHPATAYGYYPPSAYANTHGYYYAPQASQGRTVPQYQYGPSGSGYAYAYSTRPSLPGQSMVPMAPYSTGGQHHMFGPIRSTANSTLHRLFPERSLSEQPPATSDVGAVGTASPTEQQPINSNVSEIQSVDRQPQSTQKENAGTRSRQNSALSTKSHRSLRSQTTDKKPDIVDTEEAETDEVVIINEGVGEDSGVAWVADDPNTVNPKEGSDTQRNGVNSVTKASKTGHSTSNAKELNSSASAVSAPPTSTGTSKGKRGSKKASPVVFTYQKPTNKKSLDIPLKRGDIVVEVEWHRNEHCFRELAIAWTGPGREQLTYWWSPSEQAESRRIVRFVPSLNIDTGVISVTASVVQPEQYVQAAETLNLTQGVVVSLFFCEGIGRGEKKWGEVADVYWITQYDSIRLVECLIGFGQRVCHYTGTAEPRARLKAKLSTSVPLFNVFKGSTDSHDQNLYNLLTTCKEPAPCDDKRAQKVLPWTQLDKALADMLSRFWIVAHL